LFLAGLLPEALVDCPEFDAEPKWKPDVQYGADCEPRNGRLKWEAADLIAVRVYNVGEGRTNLQANRNWLCEGRNRGSTKIERRE